MLSTFRRHGFVSPIMSCRAATALETVLFNERPAVAEKAMRNAGTTLGRMLHADMQGFISPSEAVRLVVLVGKGNNSGDALMAAAAFLSEHSTSAAAAAAAAAPHFSSLSLVAPSVHVLHTFDTPAAWGDGGVKRAYDTLLEVSAIKRSAYASVFGKDLADDCDAFGVRDHFLASIADDRAAIEAVWRRATLAHGGGATSVCVLDGIFGMNFRPPLRGASRTLIDVVNDDRCNIPTSTRQPSGSSLSSSSNVRLRCAVDVPSGVGDEIDTKPFRTDITYATGIAKTAVLDTRLVGRLRFVDIDFFRPGSLYNTGITRTGDTGGEQSFDINAYVEKNIVGNNEAGSSRGSLWLASPSALTSHFCRIPRPTVCHKSTFGHCLIIAGSLGMPGAAVMAVQACLRSGCGLLTVAAPESLMGVGSGLMPEAMWCAIPPTTAPPTVKEAEAATGKSGLTEQDLLSLSDSSAEEAFKVVQNVVRYSGKKFSSALIGPGMGRAPSTQLFIRKVAQLLLERDISTVFDADALQPELVDTLAVAPASGNATVVLTPHAGELSRMVVKAGDQQHQKEEDDSFVSKKAEVLLSQIGRHHHAVIVEKGPRTCVWGCSSQQNDVCATYMPCGGPVLARGGSGDVLAGLISGALGADGAAGLSPYESVVLSTLRHGCAADAAARQRGELSSKTCDLMQFL